VSASSNDLLNLPAGTLPAALPANKFTVFVVLTPINGNYFSYGSATDQYSYYSAILGKTTLLSAGSAGQWALDSTVGSSTTLTNGGAFPGVKFYGPTGNVYQYASGMARHWLGHYTTSGLPFTLTYQYDSGTSSLWQGWDKIALQTQTGSAGMVNQVGEYIFGGLRGRDGTDKFFYLQEIILYNSALSSRQIASVEEYLTAKWAYSDTGAVLRKPNYYVQ
jgi:hypothetical protein